VQGGKLGGGSGGRVRSVYGGSFADESLSGLHERGCVSMANSGADSNGSQFFVCLKRVKEWDGKHVVFGRVVSGLRVSGVRDACVCLCMLYIAV
jgi:cyclophilin family peptidyl-prolyl cis-trans isomerase